jgi:hypothetical protein
VEPRKEEEEDQIKECKFCGICSTHVEMRNAYIILVGKPEGRMLVGEHA